jgi:hypothetical protein
VGINLSRPNCNYTRHKNQTDVVKSEGHLLNLLDRPPLLSFPFGIYVWIEQEEEKKSRAPINVMLCVKVLRRPVWSRRKDTTPCTPFEGLLAPESAGNASSTRRLEDLFRLDRVLGLSTGGTGVGRVGVTHELDGLLVCDLEDLLEAVADLHENSLRLLRGALRLASLGGVGLCAGAAGPETNTVEGLTNVDDDTHDLVVVIILELLANGAE